MKRSAPRYQEKPAASALSPTLPLLIVPVLFVLTNAMLFAALFHFYFATVVRVTYDMNTVLMPILFLTSALFAHQQVPIQHRRRFQRWLITAHPLFAIALLALRIYATHIEPHALQTRHVTIVTDKIAQPFTLLHLTDIQSAGIGGYEEKVFQQIRSLNPDLIVHTGDLLQPIYPATYQTELPKLRALFQTLSPTMGMYMVQGDTTGPIYNATPADTGGIEFLHNDEAIIDSPGIRLRLYGLNLRSSTSRTWARGGIKEWLSIDPQALNIVMGHRPDYILKFNDLPIDLCLAGHTHGGQIRLPFYGPVVTFSHIPRKWARGYHTLGNTRFNVSAGIGAEHDQRLPSIRLNCPPEMTLIQFIPSGSPPDS